MPNRLKSVFSNSRTTIYFQGNIVVRDGDINEDQVKIDLDRMGPSEEIVNQVTVNRTIVDLGYGKVFVLQVVSTKCSYLALYYTQRKQETWT